MEIAYNEWSLWWMHEWVSKLRMKHGDEVEVEWSWWLEHLQIHSPCHCPSHQKCFHANPIESLGEKKVWTLQSARYEVLHIYTPNLFTWNLQQWLPKRMSYIGSRGILDMFWRLSPTSLVSLIDIDTFQFHTSGRTLGTALGAWTSIHGGPHKGRSKEDGKINLLHPVHPLKLNMKLRFKMGSLERGDTKMEGIKFHVELWGVEVVL